MKARNLAGICAITVAILGSGSPAFGAVTVFGGGLGRDCYEAVEHGRLPGAAALQICDLALEQERLSRRDRAATHVNRGILYMRSGSHNKALSDFNRSLKIQPDLLEAKVNIGAALYNLQRYDEAMTFLNEGIETANVDAQATGYYNRALIHERRGDVEQAYYDFRKALEVQPAFQLAAKQLERFTVTATDN